ncbi:MAG: ABC transporter substrate binding protein [Mariprofundales bacterium]|nr:ABC transporter substrate binding protein [Mariprofundales bacterium]
MRSLLNIERTGALHTPYQPNSCKQPFSARTLLWLAIVTCTLLPATGSASGIAVISHLDIAPYRTAIAAFRQQVDLPVTEYLLTTESRATLRKRVAAQHPELIFVLGTPALKFTRTLKQRAPTVMAFVLHPEPLQSNEAGIAMTINPTLQLQTLLTITPNIHTIGAIYNPKKSASFIAQIKKATDKQHLRLLSRAVTTHSAAAEADREIVPQVDALWIIPDTTSLTKTLFQQVVRLALKNSIPIIGLAAKHVRAGCLFAVTFDNRAVGEQAGRLAHRLLHEDELDSRQVAQLEPLQRSRLSINTQAADLLGIEIPQRVLREADQLYPSSSRSYNKRINR